MSAPKNCTTSKWKSLGFVAVLILVVIVVIFFPFLLLVYGLSYMTCRDIDLVFLKLDSWIMIPKNFIEWCNLILTCIVQSIFRLSTIVVVAVFVVIVVWLWSLLSCTVMKCNKSNKRMKKKKNYAKMISTW